MATTVGAYIPEGTLRDAASEARLDGASKSQVVRYALLRQIMSARQARLAVFGSPDDLTETSGRVDSYVPAHELERIKAKMMELDFSEISTFVRYALALIAGETSEDAREFATVKRGRPRKDCSLWARLRLPNYQ